MTRKYTNKELKNWGVPVLSIGYCRIQTLLNYIGRDGWTESRVYGWRSDVYFIDGVIISTGYGPCNGIKPPYELTKKYEDEALKIRSNTAAGNWRAQDEKIRALLTDFINEALATA